MPAFSWRDGVVDVDRCGPVAADVWVPGSKSLTNRYLLLASLARGESRLLNPLVSEDTTLMVEALGQCGVAVTKGDATWTLAGKGRLSQPQAPIYVGNAGTVMRFLTPALAAFPIEAELFGSERMAQRPISDLVRSLQAMGVELTYGGRTGYPPVRLRGPMTRRNALVHGARSSQFASGILMSLPCIGGGVVELSGELVSRSYLDMTLDCMARFGAAVESDADGRTYRVADSGYRGCDVEVEADASTASYWFALPLMVGGRVRVRNATLQSHQGDIGLVSVLQRMGARVHVDRGGIEIATGPLRGVDVDMNSMSDVAPTLMVIATRAESPTTIRGIGHMRIKECDRIATMQNAFDRLGLKLESGNDWVRVEPGRVRKPALLDPADDHRMAMVFALLGLADGGVSISNAMCVEKTYPSFYEDLARTVG